MGAFNTQTWNSGQFGGGGPSNFIQVLDILNQAFRIAGVMKAPGRGLSPEQQAEGLLVLNTMLDGWSVDRLKVGYAYPRAVFNINANQQDYFIGPNATDPNPANIAWQAPRPPRIDYAGIIVTYNPLQPLEIPMYQMDYSEWSQVNIKQTPTTFPLRFYYEAENPNGVVHVWPLPTQGGNQIALYVWQLIGAFLQASQQAVLPPAYLRAIVYNLARDLNDRYPHAVMKDSAFKTAVESLKEVMRANVPFIDAHPDPAAAGREPVFNIYVGDTTRTR